MNRREFITLLGGAAAAWPLAARAPQPAKMARIGILNYAAAQDVRVNQFRDALRQLGYAEGINLAVTYRWADGVLDRLPELAAELAAIKVDVIIALGPAVWAAKRATTTVPIVIAFSGDPVGDGVVSSLARPGGNITGFSYMSTDLVLLSQKVAADREENHLFGKIHTSAIGRLEWVCRDQTMVKRGFRPMWRGSRA
jgi:putative tryptophan/tyrosine transport system substrate-binding protein